MSYTGSDWPKWCPRTEDPVIHPVIERQGRHLGFKVLGTQGYARASALSLPGFGQNQLPMFMPVGTQATVKGLTWEQLLETGAQTILGNTYHLCLRPGSEILQAMGGLAEFQHWPRSTLTDSGGFQLVSLSKFAEVTESGVVFESVHSKRELQLSPEQCVQEQMRLGGDIFMQLDDVVPALEPSKKRVEEARDRSLRWLDRQLKQYLNDKPSMGSTQTLYGITHGGLHADLRRVGAELLSQLPLDGWAIGGLSGGEKKTDFWRSVFASTQVLPSNRPRYLMGVGLPEDLVVCVCLGVDHFDCVLPCRTARFGTAFVPEGELTISRSVLRPDEPVDKHCKCECCRNYSRGALSMLFTHSTELAGRLLTIHNLTYLARLMRSMRASILSGTLPEFVRNWLCIRYADSEIPTWVRESLTTAGMLRTHSAPVDGLEKPTRLLPSASLG